LIITFYSDSIQQVWEAELLKDPLGDKIFDYALFYPKKGSKGTVIPVHLYPENFYKGTRLQIGALFNHVDYCITTFGKENVML
jgi:hypothetical protein